MKQEVHLPNMEQLHSPIVFLSISSGGFTHTDHMINQLFEPCGPVERHLLTTD